MNPIKTYILAPNFDIPAEGPNSIRLGHIISDPKTPNIPLNRSSVVPFPPDLIPAATSKPGWTGTVSQLRAKKFGLWARFLEIIGLGSEFSVHSSIDSENCFKFESLDTTYIDPDEAYVAKSIGVDGVQRFLKAARYNKPVYMIIGLKIARGASATGSETITRGGTMKVGFHGAGPEAEITSTKTNTASFEGAEGFVFAIRLREILYKKGKDIVQKEYRNAVVLGTDEDEDEDDEENRDVITVFGLKSHDAEDFQGLVSSKTVVEEDSEEVQCLTLRL